MKLKKISYFILVFILFFNSFCFCAYCDDTTAVNNIDESTTLSGTKGGWASVRIKQSGILESSCTLCAIVHTVQNSGTLKSEYQMKAGTYTNKSDSDFSSKWGKFQSNLWSGGLKGQNDTLKYLNSVSNSEWSIVSGNSDGSYSTGATWDFCLGLGGVDFKDMTLDQLQTALKAFWNNGYFVIIGIKQNGASADSNGPKQDKGIYRGQHWVTLCDLSEDGDILVTDSTYGGTSDLKFYYNSGQEAAQIVHMVLLKNSSTSLMDAAKGKKASIPKVDTSSSGETNETVNEDGLVLNISKQAYYGEEEISAYCKLQELNLLDIIDDASYNNLTSLEQSNLTNWINVVEEDKVNHGFIYVVRVFVSIFGIILIVWSVLLYLAFWFDRINNIFDFDLLLVITFGQLRVSESDDDCSYGAIKPSRSAKTVNHKAIVLICITAIGFGVLIISGKIYTIVSAIVYKVLELLS